MRCQRELFKAQNVEELPTSKISITVNKDDHGRESLQQQFCLACKPSYMRQWGTLCLELCLAAWQIYTIFASVSANSARQQERNLEEQAHSIAVDDGEAVAQKEPVQKTKLVHYYYYIVSNEIIKEIANSQWLTVEIYLTIGDSKFDQYCSCFLQRASQQKLKKSNLSTNPSSHIKDAVHCYYEICAKNPQKWGFKVFAVAMYLIFSMIYVLGYCRGFKNGISYFHSFQVSSHLIALPSRQS
ncbi:Puromycin-sensitive aminopeptidase-like protein [Trichinella pseudospiralis]